MTRLHRSLPSIALACALTVPSLVIVPLTYAQQSPAPAAAAPAQQQEDPKLRQAADDFWHYAKIARYDLANQAAQNLITNYKDQGPALLRAFQRASSDRGDSLDQWLLRWQQVPALRENVNQVISLLNQGRFAHRSDISFIQSQIERLSTNERAYTLGIQQLRNSGELAVPVMLDYLRDASKSQYHASIRRALIDMGRSALNPLVAATEMQETDTLITVIDALGNIGYDVSVPYLLRLATDANRPGAVQDAATRALVRMGVDNPKSMSASESFYDLAEKFYYDQAAVTAPQGQDVAYVWYWDQQNGLTKKNVPAPIFNELMAMRACEYALKLDPNSAKSVSLWIAANFKREAELPQGASDPTRGENQPDAHYYAVASGVQFLSPTLARALRDHNAPVAFKTLKALQVTAGNASLFSQGGAAQPVVDALSFPDRVVRFEAAYTVGSAVPQQDFQGKDRTVQVLADALNATGKPSVLAVLPNQNDVNALAEGLGQSMNVAGATTAAAAVEQSAKLPSVDYILISEDLPADEVSRVIDAANTSPRLDGAARVILTHTPASRYASMSINNPMVTVSQATPSDAAAIKSALSAAQQKSGGLTLDDQTAAADALRSAELLASLASSSKVFDLNLAQPALLNALSNPSPDLVRATGAVLAHLPTRESQSGLLAKSLDQATPDDLKISLLSDLATSAKLAGNQLDEQSIASLEKAVHDTANLQVRSAAAEARGALNLPADQAKKLILEQSRV